jgi:hypothetical protein
MLQSLLACRCQKDGFELFEPRKRRVIIDGKNTHWKVVEIIEIIGEQTLPSVWKVPEGETTTETGSKEVTERHQTDGLKYKTGLISSRETRTNFWVDPWSSGR